MVGLLLEENPVVLGAVNDAAIELMKFDPNPWLSRLTTQNRELQKQLAVALADYIAEETKEARNGVQRRNWQSAAAVSGYRPLILETLASRLGDESWQIEMTSFAELMEDARMRMRKAKAEGDGTSEALRGAAIRLRNNATILAQAVLRFPPGITTMMSKVFLSGVSFQFGNVGKLQMQASQLQDISCYSKMPGSALYHGYFQGAELNGADLEGAALFGCGFERASLYNVNLKNADLERSSLKETTIMECALDGARLYGVQIDDGTKFYHSNWWAADFAESNGPRVDEQLLEKLYKRVLALNEYNTDAMFGSEIDPAKWLDVAHPTVREFVEAKQQQKKI